MAFGIRVTRRSLVALMAGTAALGGFRFGGHRIARQAEPTTPLSKEAQALINAAWVGLDAAKVIDGHVHVIGLGAGGTGCYANPRMQSWANPAEAVKFGVYLEASGITDPAHADQQFIDRLRTLARTTQHGRLLLFPFDQFHDDAGKAQPAQSEFHTPNAYVAKLAKEAPDVFVAAASIHPYRADAVEALERAVEAGAVAVKWLPNAMNIDPASSKCDAFYAALARLQIPLITHAGEEKAVHADDLQRLGNPLKLRRALEKGATVVVAHCASLGTNPDLDSPSSAWVDNFDLFMRLMGEPQWNGRLFGEISAVTLINRIGRPLETILKNDDLQRRLINGSDYPLPAVNVLMQTRPLASRGWISEPEREWLNEIDRHNPLLYDFVMKRTLRFQDAGVTRKLADDIFVTRPQVFPRLA